VKGAQRDNRRMHQPPPAPSAPSPAPSPSVSDSESPAPPPAKTARRDPLHGLTLEMLLVELQAYFGWEGLADRIEIRCFYSDPSIASSLKFLRKTPWARAKVESLYLFMLREQERERAQRR